MKGWLRASLVLALLCFCPACAELTEVQLNSEPQGAVITDQFGNEIGITGQPLHLDLSLYGSNLEVTLSLEGYESKLERIKVRQLGQSKKFPEKGAVALRSTSVWVSLKTSLRAHPLVAVGLALFALAGGTLGLRKRRHTQTQLARAGVLESIRARAESTGDTLLGTVLGRYRLTEQLGEGGTARVYQAVPDDSLEDSEAVAIKVLHPESEQDEDFLERFRREVTIWQSLSHANIVTFLDWGEQDGLTYLVMELIKGDTLRSKLKGNAHKPAEALAMMKPIFAAVSHAHSRGVVHRDLKPENVMISGDVMKVADFGLARSGSEDKLTKTGTWLGTPQYIAPEQVRGLELTTQTDQYSLGIMLYELLSGAPPFEGDQVHVIFQQISSKPASLASKQPDLSPEVVATVERMLAKEPSARFPDLSQAEAALEAACG